MVTQTRPFNSWDAAKVIGLLLMFVDHAGVFFFPHDLWLRAVGRGAAPIFMFLAGYASSYRFSRELLILAVLMQLSNVVMEGYPGLLNILFSILFYRAVLQWLEKRGRPIERPFEWILPLLLFNLIANFLFQYGTLGFMFAMAGYMKRRPHYYSTKAQHRFLVITLASYAVFFGWLFRFTWMDALVMLPVLYGDYILLWRLEVRPLGGALSAGLIRALKWVSEYSGYIYVVHLVALSWVTHIPL